MNVKATSIDGVQVLERNPYVDSRGTFLRHWCKEELSILMNNESFVQSNLSFNPIKGTVRGLHGQSKPYEEFKHVSCLIGSIFDVVLDSRIKSSTYGLCLTFLLDSPTKSILIPPGCLHGFQSLRKDTLISYQVSKAYQPNHEIVINPLDKSLGIDWPMTINEISDKDRNAPGFKNA